MEGPEIVLSTHARRQAARRGLDERLILEVARRPEQVIPLRPGREVRQSRVTMGPAGEAGRREYLVRVFVDIGALQETVVTAYRSSRIAKYWSGS